MAVRAETDRYKYHVTKISVGKGIKTDLVVTKESLPTSMVYYRLGDVACVVDIVLDVIKSQVPCWDCWRMLGSV